jgi:hypothetical protein
MVHRESGVVYQVDNSDIYNQSSSALLCDLSALCGEKLRGGGRHMLTAYRPKLYADTLLAVMKSGKKLCCLSVRQAGREFHPRTLTGVAGRFELCSFAYLK